MWSNNLIECTWSNNYRTTGSLIRDFSGCDKEIMFMPKHYTFLVLCNGIALCWCVNFFFLICAFVCQEDYRQAVRELDEKQIVCLRLTLCEMRNHYVSNCLECTSTWFWVLFLLNFKCIAVVCRPSDFFLNSIEIFTLLILTLLSVSIILFWVVT